MTWAPKKAQAGIYNLLSTDVTLATLFGKYTAPIPPEDEGTISPFVYDHVPDDTAFPYIQIRILPWTDRGNHTNEGLACEFQITVWYQEPGRGNAKVQDIQERIDQLIHSQEFCIDGWNIILCRRTFIDILTDEDNVTKQGIQRFQLDVGVAT